MSIHGSWMVTIIAGFLAPEDLNVSDDSVNVLSFSLSFRDVEPTGKLLRVAGQGCGGPDLCVVTNDFCPIG